MSISAMSTKDLVAWLGRWDLVQVRDVQTGAIVTTDASNKGAVELLREASARLAHLDHVVHTVRQAVHVYDKVRQ